MWVYIPLNHRVIDTSCCYITIGRYDTSLLTMDKVKGFICREKCMYKGKERSSEMCIYVSKRGL